MPLPRTTARALMNHLHGKSVFTVVTPLKLQLVGPSGEISNPAPVAISLSTAVDLNDETRPLAESTNTSAVRFSNFPSQQEVTHWRIIDSSASPQVLWTGAFTRLRTVPAGDDFEVPTAELLLELEKEV
jgi:hypothetical protein